MTHTVGEQVVAAQRLYDNAVDGREVLVARTGDRGRVEYVGRDGVPFVRFERTGRAIDCEGGDLDAR